MFVVHNQEIPAQPLCFQCEDDEEVYKVQVQRQGQIPGKTDEG